MKKLLLLILFSLTSINLVGVTFSAIKREIKDAVDDKRAISIKDLGGLGTLQLPPIVQKELGNITFTQNALSEKLVDFNRGFSLTGKAQFLGQQVDANVTVADMGQYRGLIITLSVPDSFKPSDFGKEYKPLDILVLTNKKLIISTIDYESKSLETLIRTGLNMHANVQMKGPFEWLGTMINLKRVTERTPLILTVGGDATLDTFVAPTFLESSVGLSLPVEVGIDFTAPQFSKFPKFLTDTFRKLTYGNFGLGLIGPPSPGLSLSSQVTLIVKGQEPLKFRGTAIPTLTSTSIRGELASKLEMLWLALEDVALQVDWEYKVLAALFAAQVYIPLTGLQIRGILYLGKSGDKRASIDLGMKGSLDVEGALQGFAFKGSATNLRFSDFITYLGKLAKKDLKLNIPQFSLNNLECIVAPSDTFIAGKLVESTLKAEGEIEIFNRKGGLSFELDPDNLFIDGRGYMDKIDTKIFKLTGVGLDKKSGTKDDGPVLHVFASATKPDESGITIDGTLEIPPLKIKESGTFSLTEKGIIATFESKIADIQASYNITVPQKVEDLNVEFEIKPGQLNKISKYLKQGAQAVTGELRNALSKIK